MFDKHGGSMGISTIITVLTLLSGVALFLYGMQLMGEGLKQVAGNKLELILYKLTSTPLKGFLLGTVVTALIQSSGATTVMVVGFVNSGLMKLSQAIGIIMGANIGTSITGWIICLSYIDGQQGLASLLSTATISAVVAILGIVFRMFMKKDIFHATGNIMLGFAILMVGMQTMSGAVSPLSQSPAFTSLLTSFTNPVMGILFGILITAVLQSASAACGVLQALSVTGGITFASAFPMLMGVGIGAATPVLLSAIGTGTNGKRTALVYLLNDLFAMLLGSVLFYGTNLVFHYPFLNTVMNPFSIAALNSMYRFAAMLLLLPFVKGIERLTKVLIPNREDDEEDSDTLDLLEDRFLNYPDLALAQCQRAMDSMAENVVKNLARAMDLLDHFDEKKFSKIQEKENRIDKYQDKLDTYLMQMLKRELSSAQSTEVSKFLHCIPDFERIGDYSYEMAKVARDQYEKKQSFSGSAWKDLQVVMHAVKEIMDLTMDSFSTSDRLVAQRIEPLRVWISMLCTEVRHRRISRLKDTRSGIEEGFDYNELVNELERIADHCSNIAVYIIETANNDLDVHDYVSRTKKDRRSRYKEYLTEYRQKYSI